MADTNISAESYNATDTLNASHEDPGAMEEVQDDEMSYEEEIIDEDEEYSYEEYEEYEEGDEESSSNFTEVTVNSGEDVTASQILSTMSGGILGDFGAETDDDEMHNVEAQSVREQLLEKQRQLEAELEKVRKQNEMEAMQKRQQEEEIENLRLSAAKLKVDLKDRGDDEIARLKEAEERRRHEAEEAMKKAREEEEHRIAAEEAAKRMMEEEKARRQAAEEALAKAAEEKRKMESEIKRIEMELETARKAKEEAARKRDEETKRLQEEKLANEKSLAESDHKTITAQVTQSAKQAAPAPTQVSKVSVPKGPDAPVTKKKVTRRVVRKINKATGEVISTTTVDDNQQNSNTRKVVRKVVKRTVDASAPAAATKASPPPESAPTEPTSNTGTTSRAPVEPTPLKAASVSPPASSPPPILPPAAAAAAPVCNSAEGDAVGGGPSYTVTQLQKKEIPGLDYTSREKYLSASDFRDIFSCSYDQFQNWPKWKQTKAKRSAKLF